MPAANTVMAVVIIALVPVASEVVHESVSIPVDVGVYVQIFWPDMLLNYIRELQVDESL